MPSSAVPRNANNTIVKSSDRRRIVIGAVVIVLRLIPQQVPWEDDPPAVSVDVEPSFEALHLVSTGMEHGGVMRGSDKRRRMPRLLQRRRLQLRIMPERPRQRR